MVAIVAYRKTRNPQLNRKAETHKLIWCCGTAVPVPSSSILIRCASSVSLIHWSISWRLMFSDAELVNVTFLALPPLILQHMYVVRDMQKPISMQSDLKGRTRVRSTVYVQCSPPIRVSKCFYTLLLCERSLNTSKMSSCSYGFTAESCTRHDVLLTQILSQTQNGGAIRLWLHGRSVRR